MFPLVEFMINMSYAKSSKSSLLNQDEMKADQVELEWELFFLVLCSSCNLN